MIMTPTESAHHRKNSASARRAKPIAVAAALLAVINSAATATSPTPCDMRLIVELTPDVPDPRDLGFLSSLLGNHSDYRLTFQQRRGDFVFVLELTGPGPTYVCQGVVDDMRKDGRVLSIHLSAGS
jgi:hypothetical protein